MVNITSRYHNDFEIYNKNYYITVYSRRCGAKRSKCFRFTCFITTIGTAAEV